VQCKKASEYIIEIYRKWGVSPTRLLKAMQDDFEKQVSWETENKIPG
jgi:hypothetical protein